MALGPIPAAQVRQRSWRLLHRAILYCLQLL